MSDDQSQRVAARARLHLLEPAESFLERVQQVQEQATVHRWVTPLPHVAFESVTVSLAQHQTPFKDQGDRGSCWAFAGVAALEAAYRRKYGLVLDLSEHYAFHLPKAHESDSGGHSLTGFQGSSDIVRHLGQIAVPEESLAPYLSQAALAQLRAQIPRAGAISDGVAGTQEERDALEFDVRHVPLAARWNARYRVGSWGVITNFSVADVEQLLRGGHEVVVDVLSRIPGASGGHVLLLIGYNRRAGFFWAKNSWGENAAIRIDYENDPSFSILTGSAYYIKDVVDPVAPQTAAFWTGEWRMDHDGWRGTLVVRRFTDLRKEPAVSPATATKLGSYYRDGAKYDVNGYFVAGGQGMVFYVANTTAPLPVGQLSGQRFDVSVFGRDPRHAAGRTTWSGTPYGVVLSRDLIPGLGSPAFSRSEVIGNWDLHHDGWRGTLHLGADPWYTSAAGESLPVRYEMRGTPHQIAVHVRFSGDNDQAFELLHHTREDGVLAGLTTWAGTAYGVEGFRQAALYGIRHDGELLWYRHDGRSDGTFRWGEPRRVGTGWQTFEQVFGGDDGIVYAIRSDGQLLWYRHLGRGQGAFDWAGPQVVGTGWHGLRRVFSGGAGVLYAVGGDGRLLWYRHDGRSDGSFTWSGPKEVGTGWGHFQQVFSCGEGIIYALQEDGQLRWYRHDGYADGSVAWSAPRAVGTGWQGFTSIVACRGGAIYAVTAPTLAQQTGQSSGGGALLWYRHDGFQDGSWSWRGPQQVGTGWGPRQFRTILAT